jgi:hypothetical protein
MNAKNSGEKFSDGERGDAGDDADDQTDENAIGQGAIGLCHIGGTWSGRASLSNAK